jgi:hypothetical protein
MDIDCDGADNSAGGCSNDQSGQGVTAFKDIVSDYGIDDLNANIHPYVVFGNEGASPSFEPDDHGMEPLSVMAVVCGGKLVPDPFLSLSRSSMLTFRDCSTMVSGAILMATLPPARLQSLWLNFASLMRTLPATVATVRRMSCTLASPGKTQPPDPRQTGPQRTVPPLKRASNLLVMSWWLVLATRDHPLSMRTHPFEGVSL